MRVAFFSDVHCNLPALEAVLADIAAVGVDARYVLGDLVGYAPWPNEVLERLQAEGIPAVMGNYDEGTRLRRRRVRLRLHEPSRKPSVTSRSPGPRRAPARCQQGLAPTPSPTEIRFEADGLRFLLVHGSPRRINEYLYEDKPDSTFARIAEGANADVIVCGHTHRPYEKTVAGAWFVNDGSAGKPKDGDPRACWALVDTIARSVEFRRVEYDIERTAQAILASDLPHEDSPHRSREAQGLPDRRGAPCSPRPCRACAVKVSELAQRAGIAPSAVRWYESVGILPPATRQSTATASTPRKTSHDSGWW